MNPKNKMFVGAVSATLVASAALWEGTKYTPYEDIVGVLTVCQGYTGKDIIRTKRYTPEECAAFLNKELKAHGQGILKCINVPLKQHQYDAFTLFAYNVGVGAFCNSRTVAAPLNRGDYDAACAGMKKWVYAGGKYVQGLANRREYEYRMCMGEMNVNYS